MHSTEDCAVKKECDRIVAARTSNSGNTGSGTAGSGTVVNSTNTGRLRHITEESEKQVDSDVFQEAEEMHNDTNQDILNYFTRVTNHYLRLARFTQEKSLPPRHVREYPIIADSGANFHMFKEQEFFTQLTPAQGSVLLGDGKTSLPIHGIGTVTCKIGNNILQIESVRYVPDLGESIYSLFCHIQSPQHSLQSSLSKVFTLFFLIFSQKLSWVVMTSILMLFHSLV